MLVLRGIFQKGESSFVLGSVVGPSISSSSSGEAKREGAGTRCDVLSRA